jgi:SAM-dependent methyltransferase
MATQSLPPVPSPTDGASEPVFPSGSSALIPPLLATASGIVLDIGPGTGTQTPLFTNPGLREMYGAEPCMGLHAELLAKSQSAGLGNRYQILPCSAEPEALLPSLENVGFSDLERGVFDTIVCVRVLCSVPRPEETIRGLYGLLKPGGKLLVCEHVVNPWLSRKGSVFARAMQQVYGLLGWSFFLGDCHLNRDTERTLRDVAKGDGGWESADLENSFPWSTLPYVSGTLVKRS